ncbi:MAG: DMT family transporter [Planctomycetota bacterium]
MTDRRAPAPLAIALLFSFLCLVWSSTWLAIRYGLRDLPPYTSAALRFAIAGGLMAALAGPLRRLEGGTPPPLGLWSALGILNFAVSYGLVYYCEQAGLLPSIACVLWAVFPLMMALSGRLFLGERLRPGQVFGFVSSFGGVVYLFRTDLSSMGSETIPLALLLLGSPLVCAVGTTLLKKYGAGSSSVLVNRNAMLTGALLLGAFALWREHDAEFHWTGRAVLCLCYLSLFGTFLSFGIYHWLLRWTSASKMSLIAVITPALALLLDWAVGLLQPTWSLLSGTALILAGTMLVVRRVR